MRTLNEGTASEFTAVIRGDDGSIIVPTTLEYRLDCATTGNPITAWTSVTPESRTAIAIPAASNAILDDGNSYEDKVLTVKSDNGLATQKVTESRYRVLNLGGVL